MCWAFVTFMRIFGSNCENLTLSREIDFWQKWAGRWWIQSREKGDEGKWAGRREMSNPLSWVPLIYCRGKLVRGKFTWNRILLQLCLVIKWSAPSYRILIMQILNIMLACHRSCRWRYRSYGGIKSSLENQRQLLNV